MNIKDWKQYKKVLSEKMKEDEAFTLIELIVVMAILAILVLLAAPQFLGYTTKAKDAKIANDIAVAEMKTSENLIDHKWAEKDFKEWHNADKEEEKFDRDYLIENFVIADDDGSGKNGLYNKGGKIELSDEDASATEGMTPQEKLDYINDNGSIDIPEGIYRIIDGDFLDEEIRTNLDGTFFANENGEVYYTPDKNIADNSILIDDSGVVQNPSNPSNSEDEGVVDETEEGIPSHYVLAQDEDFVKSYGTFHYIGEDDYIIIPKTIQGEVVTSYRTMFALTNGLPDLNNGEYEDVWYGETKRDYSALGDTIEFGYYGDDYEWIPDENSEDFRMTDGSDLYDNPDYYGKGYYDFTDEGYVWIPDERYMTWVGPEIPDETDEYGYWGKIWNGAEITTDYSHVKGLATQDATAVTNASHMLDMFPNDTLELLYFDTPSLENALGMFAYTQLSSVDLSHMNLSNLVTIQSMFTGTPNLTHIDISSIHIDGNEFGWMFNEDVVKSIKVGSQKDVDQIRKYHPKLDEGVFEIVNH